MGVCSLSPIPDKHSLIKPEDASSKESVPLKEAFVVQRELICGVRWVKGHHYLINCIRGCRDAGYGHLHIDWSTPGNFLKISVITIEFRPCKYIKVAATSCDT